MANYSLYSKEVLKHFKKPHNFGKIKNPSGTGEVGNIICGDVMFLYIKVEKKNKGEIVKDIKFEAYGCAAAIATSSAITNLVKGKSIGFALNVTKDDVLKSLKGLPPIKIHCSLLAVDALREAIYNFFEKEGRKIPKDLITTHQKNRKEREITEEKRKQWIKA